MLQPSITFFSRAILALPEEEEEEEEPWAQRRYWTRKQWNRGLTA